MESKSTLKCEKCHGNLFEIDQVKSGYKLPELFTNIDIEGKTELIWETYFKCSNCGWGVPYPKIGLPEDPLTITFYIDNKKPNNMNLQVVKTHIENDLVNNQPKIIYTDENGTEWVHSHQPICFDGGGESILKKKSECWYFDIKNKKA